jgi:hypothetical protein
MVEILWTMGRLEAGNYWIEDVHTGVQVGWINRDENDRNWYVLDSDFGRKAGPFITLREAKEAVEDALKDEFGIGSPGN